MNGGVKNCFLTLIYYNIPMYLSVCSIFRNEAPYLKEWINFHKLVGVEHFYLYNNLSTDDWQSQIEEFDCVTVIDWPMPTPAIIAAYEDGIRRTQHSKWTAFIDVDEFLFCPDGTPLPDFLKNYEEFPAVVVNWATYGTSGHVTQPDGLVIENYTRRCVDDEGVNTHVKTIIQPARTTETTGVSHSFYYGDEKAVNANREICVGPFSAPVTLDKLRINHYLTKSEEEAQMRADKGRVDGANLARSSFEDVKDQLNAIEDKSILTYLKQVAGGSGNL